jgi:acyl-CoA synthetase (NDP forming)
LLLDRFGYKGDVHLVSRTRGQVNGRRCVPTIDDLPLGVDAAILAIPKAGVSEAVEAAGRRAVGGVIVFSSGYGEMGAAGKEEQAELARVARDNDIALGGPNCLGLVNFVDSVPLTFGDVAPNRRSGGPGVAIVAQSGAMSLALTYAAQAQDVPVTYTISTGNEAVLSLEDYLAALLEEEATRAVALLVEQIRRPGDFMALAGKARDRGVAICILHAGRGKRAQAASRSHTGAIAGDQAVLRAVLAQEGVLFVDSLDGLVDTVGFLCQSSLPTCDGVAFMTDSGAAKTIAIDMCESLGVNLPELSAATLGSLARELPPFAAASNPVDITAMGLNDPTLYPRVLKVLLDDPGVGTVVVSAMPGSDVQGTDQVAALLPALESAPKPVIYTIMGGEWPIPEPNRRAVLDAGIPLFRSPERALRAVRDSIMRATALRAAGESRPPRNFPPLPLELGGLVDELTAKSLLSKAGLPVPRSRLVTSLDDARDAARDIGYPVVLKIVSPDIAHKSDVGGIALVHDRNDLRQGYEGLLRAVTVHRPDARVTGVLVEQTLRDGVEMIVGAKKDPDWGPFILVGLGGIWTETLRDTVIVPGGASRPAVFAALKTLRGFPLLRGARGGPEHDVDALVDAVELIGGLVDATPAILELEVNPLLVMGSGRGVVALDALITADRPASCRPHRGSGHSPQP